jgi:hypothetical protein
MAADTPINIIARPQARRRFLVLILWISNFKISRFVLLSALSNQLSAGFNELIADC